MIVGWWLGQGLYRNITIYERGIPFSTRIKSFRPPGFGTVINCPYGPMVNHPWKWSFSGWWITIDFHRFWCNSPMDSQGTHGWDELSWVWPQVCLKGNLKCTPSLGVLPLACAAWLKGLAPEISPQVATGSKHLKHGLRVPSHQKFKP